MMESTRRYMKVGLIHFMARFLNPRNRPIVSFEVKPFADDDPDLVIANAKRTLTEAWARLD